MGVIPIPSRSTELERGVFFGVAFLPFLPIFVLMVQTEKVANNVGIERAENRLLASFLAGINVGKMSDSIRSI